MGALLESGGRLVGFIVEVEDYGFGTNGEVMFGCRDERSDCSVLVLESIGAECHSYVPSGVFFGWAGWMCSGNGMHEG